MRRPRAYLVALLSLLLFAALPAQATRTLPSLVGSIGIPAPLELSRHSETASRTSEKTFALFDEENLSLFAASASFDGRIPGGQTSLFQGAWTDSTTGTAYHRNRWYDPRTASWLSEDPAGAVDGPNLYAFVGWGPHMGSDPLGICLACAAESGINQQEVLADMAGESLPEYRARNSAELGCAIRRNLQRGIGGARAVPALVGKAAFGLGLAGFDLITEYANFMVPDFLGLHGRNQQRAEANSESIRHLVDTIVNSHKARLQQIERHEARGEFIRSGLASGEMGSADAAALIGGAEASLSVFRAARGFGFGRAAVAGRTDEISWLFRGAENDIAWANATNKERAMFELGQRYWSNQSTWEAIEARFPGSDFHSIVARGKGLAEEQGGGVFGYGAAWMKDFRGHFSAFTPAGLETGPTPSFRFLTYSTVSAPPATGFGLALDTFLFPNEGESDQ